MNIYPFLILALYLIAAVALFFIYLLKRGSISKKATAIIILLGCGLLSMALWTIVGICIDYTRPFNDIGKLIEALSMCVVVVGAAFIVK